MCILSVNFGRHNLVWVPKRYRATHYKFLEISNWKIERNVRFGTDTKFWKKKKKIENEIDKNRRETQKTNFIYMVMSSWADSRVHCTENKICFGILHLALTYFCCLRFSFSFSLLFCFSFFSHEVQNKEYANQILWFIRVSLQCVCLLLSQNWRSQQDWFHKKEHTHPVQLTNMRFFHSTNEININIMRSNLHRCEF